MDNICLSGGAAGADAQWGMVAGQAGHGVIHWSFAGHKVFVPTEEVVVLTDEQLSEADPALKLASKSIKRNYPPRQKYVRALLQRNWFQIKDAERVYAVSTIEDGLVQGGTGWAVQMFIDRHKRAECECYVFDQNDGCWYQWTGNALVAWKHLSNGPPVPHGVWAGIGSRGLEDEGKIAIRLLLGYKPLEGVI